VNHGAKKVGCSEACLEDLRSAQMPVAAFVSTVMGKSDQRSQKRQDDLWEDEL